MFIPLVLQNTISEEENVISLNFVVSAGENKYFSEYWCVPNENMCGKAQGAGPITEISPHANIVMVAFGIAGVSSKSGQAGQTGNDYFSIDPTVFDSTAVVQLYALHNNGGKIIISFGGQTALPQYIKQYYSNPDVAAQKLVKFLNIFTLKTMVVVDGVDFNLEQGTQLVSEQDSLDFANFIIAARKALEINKQLFSSRHMLLTVTTDWTAVNPESPEISQGNNIMVPFLSNPEAVAAIDYFQPKAYNHPYPGGYTLEGLKAVIRAWQTGGTAEDPSTKNKYTYPGVPSNKLIIGLPSGGSEGPQGYVLTAVQTFLQETDLAGFRTWDSAWDAKNNNQLSNTIYQYFLTK